jgi:hypothetical protein
VRPSNLPARLASAFFYADARLVVVNVGRSTCRDMKECGDIKPQ